MKYQVIMYYLYSRYRILIEYLEKNKKRVAGIEPASLAWKAKGYSRRRFSALNVSNSKPNVKLWFHSAPLWKVSKFLDLRGEKNEQNYTHNTYVSFLFEYRQNESLSR
jgi:hypothetical protein